MPLIALMIHPFDANAAIHPAVLGAGGTDAHRGRRGMGRTAGPAVITLHAVGAKLHPISLVAIALAVQMMSVFDLPVISISAVPPLAAAYANWSMASRGESATSRWCKTAGTASVTSDARSCGKIADAFISTGNDCRGAFCLIAIS